MHVSPKVAEYVGLIAQKLADLLALSRVGAQVESAKLVHNLVQVAARTVSGSGDGVAQGLMLIFVAVFACRCLGWIQQPTQLVFDLLLPGEKALVQGGEFLLQLLPRMQRCHRKRASMELADTFKLNQWRLERQAGKDSAKMIYCFEYLFIIQEQLSHGEKRKQSHSYR
jgi:hypothetical protein